MNLDADLSQLGQANILADFLEALELQDVTLVMNDWGGPQFVVALGRDERISRMAFVACEAFDNFPPPQARPAVLLTRAPGGAWLLMQLLRTPPLPPSPTRMGGRISHSNPRPCIGRVVHSDLLPRGRLVTISDSGTLIPEDQPTALAAVLLGFIRETAARP